MRPLFAPVVGLIVGVTGSVPAAEPSPVPATRPEMKRVLEGSKKSRPRLPLPPPTDQEKEQLKQGGSGGMGLVNNARMRRLYLSPELSGGGSSREPDPGISLDPTFKTMFFWIVSRTNNCYYCMGHQEVKLTAAGVPEDRIAALDGDWSEYTPAERAAFALTRRLTFEPHEVGDADLAALRPYYTDAQVLEILFTVAGNNATNRWTGSLAIPQEEHRVYLTPTSEKYQHARSLVAPLAPGQSGPATTCARPSPRPPLESRAEVEAALDACRSRKPRLELLDEAKARAALPVDWPAGPLPQWVRLLARFPKAGVARIVSLRAAEEKGSMSPRLKAQIAWIAARQDRAWYALGHARQRLLDQGVSEDAIFALQGTWDDYSPAERAVFAFARKLTVDPALVDDDDVAGLRRHYSDLQVAELVHLVTVAAFFDRLTEAAGLRLEE